MLQPRREPDLPLETLGTERRGQLRVEHLERHRPVMLEIPSEIHRRHAASAELALDHVAVCQRCAVLGELTLEIGHHVPAFTSFWNRGFFRSGSKVGSILSQPGER